MTGKVNEPEWMRALGRKMDAAATWDEAQAIMHSDPNWLAMMEERRAKLDDLHAQWAEAAEPILRELRGVGIDVPSVWHLEPATPGIEKAAPILLKYLSPNLPDNVSEGVSRGLGIPSLRKELWPELVARYKAEPADSAIKTGLAASLGVICDKSTLDELIGLIDDKRNGNSRILMLSAVSRSRQPQALRALQRYVNDPSIAPQAKHYLKQKERYRMRKAKRER